MQVVIGVSEDQGASYTEDGVPVCCTTTKKTQPIVRLAEFETCKYLHGS